MLRLRDGGSNPRPDDYNTITISPPLEERRILYTCLSVSVSVSVSALTITVTCLSVCLQMYLDLCVNSRLQRLSPQCRAVGL